MIVIRPATLGEIGQALVHSLKMLWATGKPPVERSAYETKVFFRRPKRAKRVKNLDTATQKQWAKYGKVRRVW